MRSGAWRRSFNAMLDALEHSMSALDASVHAQRQLVADASHELRTPVTSLRTNIEILQQQGADMDPASSAALLGDVVEQIEELTLLMNDLIDLARGEEPRADAEELRLDLLVAEVVERARRRSPGAHLRGAPRADDRQPACPPRLERAVGNLIDNALKYSPPGEPVEIELRGGELTVRDHGPGISRRRTCRTSSIASTAAPRPAGGPARAWASRSCARSPTSTAAASPPSRPPAAAR